MSGEVCPDCGRPFAGDLIAYSDGSLCGRELPRAIHNDTGYAARLGCKVSFDRRAAAFPDSVWCNGRRGDGRTFGAAAIDLARKLNLLTFKA